MLHSLVRITVLFALACLARAGTDGAGNTSFRAEVEPLVRARPDLAAPLYGLRLADAGEGTRISYLESPALMGKHVGPYEFTATNAEGRKVSVRFHTRQRYVNENGLVVADILDGELISGGSVSGATEVRENLVGITVAEAR